jgi:primosomal protein N' (replication factor Y)
LHFYRVSILGSPLEPLTYQSSENIEPLSCVTVSLNTKQKIGVVVEEVSKPEFSTVEIVSVEQQFFSQEQYNLVNFIAGYYICSLGEAFALLIPFEGDSRFHGNDGKLHRNDKEGLSQLDTSRHSQLDWESKITLSKKQNDALAFLHKQKVGLLFGDTGSGKTEIYMKYFEAVLAQDKRAIFLMPEISLTPQMSKRLEDHFGEQFIMWHSKLTPKQKQLALQKVYDGTAKIIAGARSSLFLPVKDLGLIVVDEEHDDSYKSSSRPRYHARDVAIYMGKLYDIPVVLGSATPSLTSYVKFPHTRLKGGHFNSNKEYIYEAKEESLTPLVFQAQNNRSVFYQLVQTLNTLYVKIVELPINAPIVVSG